MKYEELYDRELELLEAASLKSESESVSGLPIASWSLCPALWVSGNGNWGEMSGLS